VTFHDHIAVDCFEGIFGQELGGREVSQARQWKPAGEYTLDQGVGVVSGMQLVVGKPAF
jgi:hypothetical protein